MPGIVNRLLGTPTTTQMQETVNCGEIYYLWNGLVIRYQIREMNDLFENYANDLDWKAILAAGKQVIDKEIADLENEMKRLGIPLPSRPPAGVNTPANAEVVRDEFIFQWILGGMSDFIEEHIRALRTLTNHRLRELFTQMKRTELGFYRRLSEYGELKGWTPLSPAYHPVSG